MFSADFYSNAVNAVNAETGTAETGTAGGGYWRCILNF